MEFGHQLFGYRRSAVDRHAAEQEAALRSLKSEIDRLRAAEPLLSAAEEISGLLTSFAVAVSTTREQAERDAITTRSAAEHYAEGLKQEAMRLFEEDRARAVAVAEDIVRRAREEAAILARAHDRVELALDEAAKGIYTLIELFDHLRPEHNAGGPGAQRSDVEGGPADLAREPADLSREAADLSREPVDVEHEPADLSREPLDVEREPVDVEHDPAHDEAESAAGAAVPPDAEAPHAPGDPPYGAVPVDPTNGMIVSFSPPRDPPDHDG
jgi:hypothetical protein